MYCTQKCVVFLLLCMDFVISLLCMDFVFLLLCMDFGVQYINLLFYCVWINVSYLHYCVWIFESGFQNDFSSTLTYNSHILCIKNPYTIMKVQYIFEYNTIYNTYILWICNSPKLFWNDDNTTYVSCKSARGFICHVCYVVLFAPLIWVVYESSRFIYKKYKKYKKYQISYIHDINPQ